MAGENITVVSKILRESIGGRYLVVGTLKIPTKYLTEGCIIPTAQLQELGLPAGIVDAGIVLQDGLAAKNVERQPCQFNITNPGQTKNEPVVVKLQVYESITKAADKEVASESEAAKAAIVTVLLIGR